MKKTLLVVLGVGFGLVAVFVAWALLRTPSADESERQTMRRAIELCWADQSRKSLAPEEARAMAGMCEGMEAQFKRRWGRAP